MAQQRAIRLNDGQDFEYLEQGLKEQVAFNLRRVRIQLGVGQTAMAAMVHQSYSQYRRYEAAVDLPKLHTAIRWSLETGIPTQCLFLGSRYQPYLDFHVQHEWGLLLYFLNRAPDCSLKAFQVLLEGLNGHPLKGTFCTHTSSLNDCLDQIGEGYYRVIAERLRAFRHQHNLTQEQVASSIGLSVLTYRGYESPDKQVQFSANMIMRFWVATGVNPLMLTQDSAIHQYRQTQKHNLELLLPELQALPDCTIRRLIEVSKHLNLLVYAET